MTSRVKLALPDRSLCVEADNDEDAEEKLKPARRSRNPAKPAGPKFSEAKRHNVHQTTTSLMPLSTPASDEEEKFKPTRKACKPKAAAPARKSRAPTKKTPKHDSDADVEAPLSTNLSCTYVEA